MVNVAKCCFKCTSKGVETESRTDTTKLLVNLQQFNWYGKGRFLGWWAEEAITDKGFIGAGGLRNVAEFSTAVVWWTMSKTSHLTGRSCTCLKTKSSQLSMVLLSLSQIDHHMVAPLLSTWDIAPRGLESGAATHWHVAGFDLCEYGGRRVF